jgi:hypothetical protein
MKHVHRLACGLVAVVGLGCGEDVSGQNGTPDAGGAVTGSYNHFVTSNLKIGDTATDAAALAFVNFDGQGGDDNALGTSLANFSSVLNVDTALATAVTEGTIVILHSVRADDITADPSVSWQIWLGDPEPDPVFDGSGTFTVAANAPRNAILGGGIQGGTFSGQAAEITLELSLVAGATPLRIKLVDAHLEASVTGSSITNGRIAGLLSTQEVNGSLLPGIAALLDARIGADAGCREAVSQCELANASIRTFFDTAPNDGMISVAEVRDNVIIQGLVAPDLDLFRADGTRGTDGTRESLSIALGFFGSQATFTAPTE